MATTDRRGRRHARAKQEILDAAWTLARSHGLTGWSLREVAEAVGMRAPSLYVYFDGKDAIYDAMFAQGYRELLEEVAARRPDGPPEEVLRLVAQTTFEFSVADPARFQLMFLRVIPGFTPTEDSYALARDAYGRLVDLFDRIGMTDPGTVDLWTALVTGLASQQISNDPGGDRWAHLVDRAVAMFLAGQGQDLAGPTPRRTA